MPAGDVAPPAATGSNVGWRARWSSLWKPGIVRNVLAWFIATAIVLASVSVYGFVSVTRLIDHSRLVGHTQAILREVIELDIQLVAMQSSVQSYILSGDVAYLGPYSLAKPQLQPHLDRLAKIANDDPNDIAALQRFGQQMQTQVAIFDHAIDAYRHDPAAAANRLTSADARRGLEQLRGQLAALRSEHEKHLSEERESYEDSAASVFLAGELGLVACVLIQVLICVLVTREVKSRTATEARLEQTNYELAASLTEMRKLNQEASLVCDLGEYLQMSTSAEEVYQVLVRHLPQLLPGCNGALAIVNPSQALVETVAQWGPASPMARVFEPDECWGLRMGREHGTDPGGTSPACHHFSHTARSHICLPLTSQGTTLGVLTLAPAPGEAFNEATQKTARVVAEQTSLALANLKLQRTLREQSIQDPLTGLFNRRFMEASVERELVRGKRYGHPIGFIMLDVDHFKRFNDQFGHDAGDKLLAEFGKFLKKHVRGDDIACRYGGEEFILILPGSNLEDTTQRAEQVRLGAKKLDIRHKHESLGAISISLGVAVAPLHADDCEGVIRAADQALYRAKRAGRDQVVVADHPRSGRFAEPADDDVILGGHLLPPPSGDDTIG